MTVAIHRLGDGARPTVTAHFLALPFKDRRLRFGTALAPRAIAAYVDGIDFDRDAVFGVHDDRLMLVGLAHVAFEEDGAELGLSVLPARRGLGLGVALFKRALAHARNRGTPRLFMHYVSGNAPIMRIARRFDMDIVAGACDADAHLNLPPASPASLAGELMTDTFALCDRTLKALVAAWIRHRGSKRTWSRVEIDSDARPPAMAGHPPRPFAAGSSSKSETTRRNTP